MVVNIVVDVEVILDTWGVMQEHFQLETVSEHPGHYYVISYDL